MMKLKNFVLFLMITSFFLLPVLPAQAAGVIPDCYAQGGTNNCTVCDMFTMISNIINVMVTYIMIPLAGLLFAAGGIMVLMGGASEEWYKKGKKSLVSTAFGVAIVLASWLIINTIITVFVNTDAVNSASWYQVNCGR